MSTRSLFIELSTAFTGVDDLPADLASEYEERLRSLGLERVLNRLLASYGELKALGTIDDESIAATLASDPVLRSLAEQIIVLWYSSATMAFDDKGQIELIFGKPEHHFRALLWDVIGAHPPALSGGYFGYWHYPPEN